MRLGALVPLFACAAGVQATPHAVSPAPPPALVPPAATYPDLPAALAATIPADARVVGFGELHARTDRAQVRTTLARFTADALPALAAKLSDLIIETWLPDQSCQETATKASAQVTTTMRRPAETKNEIGELAEAARAAGIQPHAMRVTCADYARIAPPGKAVDVPAMLTLETSELGRIASEAVAHRDREPGHRPWIALYGGALHNDRFPAAAVADWSYAAKADAASGGHFVEIDLIEPELADGDAELAKEPWYPLVTAHATGVRVWKRGERSFVVVFPRSAGAADGGSGSAR